MKSTTNRVYRLVSIFVFSVALSNYTEQMILRRPRKGWERGLGTPSFSENIHRAFWRKLVSSQCCQCLSCWREKWLIVERFKRTKRSNTGYMLYHIDICYIILNSYNLKDFFLRCSLWGCHVLLFFKECNILSIYLHLVKEVIAHCGGSNNKLLNRVSHNAVTWDVDLHLFIIPLLTHFFLIPVDSLLENYR